MLQDQDFQVSRTTVASPESEQAGRDLHDEVEEKEHRGMVEEPLVEDRIRVSDPYADGWEAAIFTYRRPEDVDGAIPFIKEALS
jgi:hypothetical protein